MVTNHHGAEDNLIERQNRAFLALLAASQNRWPVLMEPSSPLGDDSAIAVPDIQHRLRVGDRNDDPTDFLAQGRLHMRLILNLYEVYSGRQSISDAKILDWGVGCARTLRFTPELARHGIAGIDIDPINISWCERNLPFGDFAVVEPFGRTPFADRSFDLIYSHSVMTHLSEDDQFVWLKELSRISRGILLFSVHGPYSAATRGTIWAADPPAFLDWLEKGFRNPRRGNEDLADIAPEGYYRDVAHTATYIKRAWSRYVEVLDVISGGFGTSHDAVVCRAYG